MLESFLRLLEGGSSDGVVWCADLTWWVDGNRRADLAGEVEHLRFCRELGTMPYYWYGKFWAGEAVYDGVGITTLTSGDTRQVTWSTPVGAITGEYVTLDRGRSEACARYPVRTEEDLGVLLDLLSRRRLAATNLTDYGERRVSWAAHGGLPCLALPRSPLSAFFTEWAGVEHGALLAIDRPATVERVLDHLERQEAGVLAAVSETRPPLVHFADNLSSDAYTSFFDRHMADRYARRLAALHAAGVRAAVHLDGSLAGLLPRLAAIGFDAIEAVTPAPCGDVTVEEMRAVTGSDAVILWGGIPGAMFAPPFGWPEVRDHLERLLEAWRGTRFVVGVADQVPPNGDLEIVRRIAEVIHHG